MHEYRTEKYQKGSAAAVPGTCMVLTEFCGYLYYHRDKELQDASDIFKCCLLAGNVIGGTKYVPQVHQGASTDIIMERRDEIRGIL